GGMAFRQGKTQVNNAVSVDEKDIAAFRKLHERNIELEVRNLFAVSVLQQIGTACINYLKRRD
ncbi:PTS sugar transporter subunit IIB, partial [Pantoea agglomerans]|uniref:PTS sugar transporter subunit IIB n=1 Tax=Enterobacter agglomerans TaxID=549 RepID=UPI001A8E631D